MTALVIDLQKKALDSKTDITELIRFALVVATKLEISEFKHWIEKEIKGYEKNDQIPSYRIVEGQIKAWNPYNGWIPIIFENHKEEKKLSSRSVGQSIGSLEDLLKNSKQENFLQIPYPLSIQHKLRKGMDDLPLTPTLIIGKTQLFGILDAVRNVILDWSLKLEKDGIVGEGMTFSKNEKVLANQSTYNIENFTGNIGNISGDSIQIGNYNTIHAKLKSLGISQKERNELEDITDQLSLDTGEEKDSLLTKGIDWVNRNKGLLGPCYEEIKSWFS